MGVNQSYFNNYVNPLQKEIDRVNVYEFESGMDYEMTNLGGLVDPETIKKAQKKVLANLKKDPAYYTNKLAADSVKLVGEWGSGKKPGKRNTAKSAEAVKAEVKTPKDETPVKDKSNEMKVAKKDAKSNVRKDSKAKNPNNPGKVATMTQTPKKARGAKMMAMPGKEKKVALKENFSGPDTSLEEKLRKNAPISKYVKDFEKSDAPQFKGKTAKEKRNMAIAAHAQANPKNPMRETETHNERMIKIIKQVDPHSPLLKQDPEEWDSKEFKKIMDKYHGNDKIIDMMKKGTKLKEDVQVQDSRKIRLTPENLQAIKGMIKEMIYQSTKDPNTVISVNPGDKITKDTQFSSKFKPLP